MVTQQENARDKKSFTGRVLEEINNLTHKQFHIGLIGNEEIVKEMKDWLGSFSYELANKMNVKIKSNILKDNSEIEKYLVCIHPSSDYKYDEKLIKSTAFCIVENVCKNDIRRLNVPTYIFEKIKVVSYADR